MILMIVIPSYADKLDAVVQRKINLTNFFCQMRYEWVACTRLMQPISLTAPAHVHEVIPFKPTVFVKRFLFF